MKASTRKVLVRQAILCRFNRRNALRLAKRFIWEVGMPVSTGYRSPKWVRRERARLNRERRAA